MAYEFVRVAPHVVELVDVDAANGGAVAGGTRQGQGGTDTRSTSPESVQRLPQSAQSSALWIALAATLLTLVVLRELDT